MELHNIVATITIVTPPGERHYAYNKKFNTTSIITSHPGHAITVQHLGIAVHHWRPNRQVPGSTPGSTISTKIYKLGPGGPNRLRTSDEGQEARNAHKVL